MVYVSIERKIDGNSIFSPFFFEYNQLAVFIVFMKYLWSCDWIENLKLYGRLKRIPVGGDVW